jgi:predicted nucleotidyltransferase
MTVDPRLARIVAAQPYPLLFATISGAHLYGFPSPDSDYDLRGAHVLPLRNVVGLQTTQETIEDSRVIEALEMDIVTHDLKKFFGLLLKKNGYVLEQLFSPLIVQATREHAELKEICRTHGARGVVTRYHAHHYLGFAQTQWKLFEKENPRRVKPLLYVYRVLLTGIHLMRTGEINANLVELNCDFKLPFLPDLVAQKQSGENAALMETDVHFHQLEYERLCQTLEHARDESPLPEAPDQSTKQQLHELLVRIRISGLN